MFYFLSKLLDKLLLPAGWVALLLIAGLLARTPRRRLQWWGAAGVVFGLLTNPLLYNQMWLAWERPPVPVDQVGVYDVGIVLTGITTRARAPHDRVYIYQGSDRVLHTVQLYRLGRLRHILLSGGPYGTDTTNAAVSEAGALRRLLLDCGVPDSVITVEATSRNTRENALHVARILKRHPEWRRQLLITSAYHMRRAEGCFRRVGLAPAIYPVDFATTYPQPYDFNTLLLPSEHAFFNWSRIIREMTGYAIYRLMGYC